MNENLQSAISALIQKSLNGLDSATYFLEGQLPDYVEQLLLWKATHSFLVFALLVAACVGLCLLTKYCYGAATKAYRDKERYSYDRRFAYTTAAGVSAALLLPFVSGALKELTWLQILFAAMDRDGTVCMHKERPYVAENPRRWSSESGYTMLYGIIDVDTSHVTDWRLTLTERPEGV